MTISHIWYITTAKNKNEQQQYSSEMTQMFAKIIQICVYAHIRRKMHAKIRKKSIFCQFGPFFTTSSSHSSCNLSYKNTRVGLSGLPDRK